MELDFDGLSTARKMVIVMDQDLVLSLGKLYGPLVLTIADTKAYN